MTVTKVVGIGPNVFGGRVTGIDFSNTIKRIGYQAFNGSIMPSTMNIPESITTIDAHAFYECRKLKSVYIPAIVTSIGYAPFYNCYDLEEIVVASDNPNYKSVDGVLYNKDMTEVIQYPGGKTKRTYVAPSSVVSINREAFACNRNVYSVVLPYGVRYLSVAAFNNATLHDIFLPASMVDIGDAAFTPFRTGFTNQPKIYVMSGTRRQYLSAVPWSGEENIIEAEFVQK